MKACLMHMGGRSISKPARSHPLIIALVFCAGLGAAAQFGKIAVALDAFRALYPVGEVALGYLISCVGTVGLIFGVVGGALLGRIGIRRAMIWGLAAAGLLSIIQASLPSYPTMVVLRVIEGFSHLAIVIAGPILMARHSSDKARPAVMTLWSAFFGLAYMLIALIAGPLINAVALGGYLAAHGIWMLALAVALHLILPPAGNRSKAERATDITLRAMPRLHVEIYRSPWLSAPGLGFVCYTVLYIALLTYLPDFALERQRAGMSATMPLVSIATSLTLGIWLLANLPAIRAVQIGFIIIAIFALPLVPFGSSAGFALASIALLGATGIVPGASFAALAELTTSDHDRALATGALAQMGNVGTTTGPPLLAAIISVAGLPGIVGFVLFFCALGIGIHTVQARRRAAT